MSYSDLLERKHNEWSEHPKSKIVHLVSGSFVNELSWNVFVQKILQKKAFYITESNYTFLISKYFKLPAVIIIHIHFSGCLSLCSCFK